MESPNDTRMASLPTAVNIPDNINKVPKKPSQDRPDYSDSHVTDPTCEQATIKDIDDEALHLQGHDSSMPHTFSPIASIGLAFSITGSWVGYLSCFGANIDFAGPQNVVLGLVVGTTVQWIITLGLAEIASAFPSSGVCSIQLQHEPDLRLCYYRANIMLSSA